MLVTVGTDKMCKIWDITTGGTAEGTYEPECVSKKDMKQGDLFTVQMYEDIPWVLATGGQTGQLAIWDTEEDSKVRKHFKHLLPEKAKTLKKTADRGFGADDADMVEGGDSSDFEDVDSDEEDETQEEAKKPETITAKPKDKKSKKKSK